MSQNHAPQAHITTVAEFPAGSFLENLVVRADGSVLITEVNHHGLWYVPPSDGHVPVEPVHLHTLRRADGRHCGAGARRRAGLLDKPLHHARIPTCTGSTSRTWSPGAPLKRELAFTFPKETRGPNGVCLFAPRRDPGGGLLRRPDLADRSAGRAAGPRLAESIPAWGYYPGKLKPEQPGVNGIHYAARSHYLYYSATANKLFMRVPVNPTTLEPAGEPEYVVAGRMGDDFCIDEDAQVIYLTTHRQNTIDIVSMDPGLNSGFTQSVAGDPFTYDLIGPSAGAWGRRS